MVPRFSTDATPGILSLILIAGLTPHCSSAAPEQDHDLQPAADAQQAAVSTQLGDARPTDARPTDARPTEDSEPSDSLDQEAPDLDQARAGCHTSCAVAVEASCKSIPSQADCIAQCEVALVSACAAQWGALTLCAASATVDDYECDRLGAPTLRAGVCEQELAALKKCLTGFAK